MRKPVYIFDYEGNFIEKLNTDECCEAYMLNYEHLAQSIKRKELVRGKWYFSRKMDFVPNIGKGSHNILNANKFGTYAWSFREKGIDDKNLRELQKLILDGRY